MKRLFPLLAVAAVLLLAVGTFIRAASSTDPATGTNVSASRESPRVAAVRSGAAAGTVQMTPSAANVRHDFKARLADLAARIEAAPGDTTALHELARMEFDAHSMSDAAGHYERYLELNPDSRQGWLDLATARASLSDWEGAQDAMVKLLDRYPDDPAASYNMGAILANRGETEQARDWWQRVIRGSDHELARRAGESLARLDR